MTETEIRKQILDWLLAHPDISLAMQLDRKGIRGRKLINKYRPAGVPDILFIRKNGQAGFIEVKVPGGRKSEEQKEFIRKISCFAIFAESLEQVKEAFIHAGI